MSSPPPLELGPCRRCGYDLRGLRPGGKCPECGEAIPKGTATLGGEAAKRASEVSLGLDWIARAALWPLPLAVGCAQLSGCFGAPILVATTGFSWLRLLGIQKVSAAWPDAPNRGLATGIASVECAIAGILALSTIFATAGPLPFAMPSVALPAWILAATVSTITARRLTVDVVTSAGGGTGRGVLETLGSAGLLLGGIAMAGGRATAWALGTGAANAAIATIVALSLVGGLVLGASALAIWFSTSRLAGEFPSLPRFRPSRGPAIEGGLPPKPEPAPMDVAPPRPVAEREPIELEPPTLPKERPEAATREIPEKTEEADDDLWNGWKR
jgi:hypothetical protein